MTTKFEQYEYNICGIYLSALINGDHSGLENMDEDLLRDFLDSEVGRLGGHWSVDSEEPGFCTDDISGLLADCHECIRRLYFYRLCFSYNVPVKEELNHETP